MATNLPHEIEVRVLEDVSILQKVSVVLPDPFFQLLTEYFSLSFGRWTQTTDQSDKGWPAG